jgi:hypothetical protein
MLSLVSPKLRRVALIFQGETAQEYVDEKGRRVKRIVLKTYVTKTVTIKGQQVVEQEPQREYPVEQYPELPAEEMEPILAGKAIETVAFGIGLYTPVYGFKQIIVQ